MNGRLSKELLLWRLQIQGYEWTGDNGILRQGKAIIRGRLFSLFLTHIYTFFFSKCTFLHRKLHWYKIVSVPHLWLLHPRIKNTHFICIISLWLNRFCLLKCVVATKWDLAERKGYEWCFKSTFLFDFLLFVFSENVLAISNSFFLVAVENRRKHSRSSHQNEVERFLQGEEHETRSLSKMPNASQMYVLPEF